MTRIEKGRLPALALALSLLVLVWACSKGASEEDRIRELVQDVTESARAKDLKGIMKHVSRDYNDESGNDHRGLKGMIFYQFFRTEKVGVVVRGVEVEVQGEKALVDTKLFLVRGRHVEKVEDIIPEEASGYRLSVVFRKEDGEWKALSANWDRVGVLGLL
jgi:ketosteroid isomerase-like protein